MQTLIHLTAIQCPWTQTHMFAHTHILLTHLHTHTVHTLIHAYTFM